MNVDITKLSDRELEALSRLPEREQEAFTRGDMSGLSEASLRALEVASESQAASAPQTPSPAGTATVQPAQGAPAAITGTPPSPSAPTDPSDPFAGLEALLSAENQPTMGDQLANAAKTGLSRGAGMLTAGIARLGDAAIPGRLAAQAMTGETSAAADRASQAGYEGVQKPLEDAMGVQSLQEPKSMVGRAANAAVEAVADPTSYIPLTGGAPRNAAGAAWRMVSEMLGAGGAGIGGQVGGEFGAQVGGTAGAVTGAVVGGVAGGASQSAVRAVQGPVLNAASRVAAKVTGSDRKVALEAQASQAVRRLLETSLEADPQSAERLVQILDAAQRSGIQLPIGAADNAVIASAIQSRASTDPVFRQKYERQVKDAEEAIAKRAEETFGNPEAASVRLSNLDKVPERVRLEDVLSTRHQSLVQASQKLSDDILKQTTGDSQALGARIMRLVETQEQVARQGVKPFYDEAFKAAGGAAPSGPALDALREQAKSLNDKEFLRALPVEAQRLIRRLAEGEAPAASGLLDASGRPIPGGAAPAGPAKAFSLEDLDYTKRAVNKALREATPGSDRYAALMELRNRVRGAVDSMPPEFVAAYRRADEEFMKAVGLPFDRKALEQLNRANFDEQALPILTRNKSAMQAFLDVGGPDAGAMAKAALLADLGRKVDGRGVLRAEVIDAWLRTPKGQAASAVPGLAEELKGASGGLAAVAKAQADADALFKDRLIARMVSTYGKSAESIGAEALSSPGMASRYVDSFKGGKDAADGLRAVQSLALDHALKQSDPLAYLDATGRKTAADSIFGAKYLGDVRMLADMRSQLAKAYSAPAFNLESVPKDVLEKGLGISGPGVLSILRDQITSGVQKVALIGSKIGTAKLSGAEDQAIAKALLEPKVFQEQVRALQAAATDKGVDLAAYVRSLSSTGGREGAKAGLQFLLGLARSGVVGARAGGDEERRQGVGGSEVLQ